MERPVVKSHAVANTYGAVRAPAPVPLELPADWGELTLTGLGPPSRMETYVADGTVTSFALWDPGKLAARAAAALVSGQIKGTDWGQVHGGGARQAHGRRDRAGPPTVFTRDNIGQYDF